MRDGPLRSSLKLLALLRFRVDLTVTRAVRSVFGEPAFVLRGSCRCCGGCCRTPMVRLASVLYFLPSYRRLLIAWHGVVNGFEYLGSDRRSRTLVFRCSHWDERTRRCDSYRTRPGMCRDYPRPLLFSTDPQLLAGCGYLAVDRRSRQLQQALAGVELSPERRAELERRLHINEP